MFTGIIEGTGKVRTHAKSGGNIRIEVEKPLGWKLEKGQSISVDGICSTVVATSSKSFSVEYMPETLRKTTAGAFTVGTLRNLERSLTLAKFIDGHLVQGHVDARAKVAAIEKKKGAYLVTIRIPRTL